MTTCVRGPVWTIHIRKEQPDRLCFVLPSVYTDFVSVCHDPHQWQQNKSLGLLLFSPVLLKDFYQELIELAGSEHPSALWITKSLHPSAASWGRLHKFTVFCNPLKSKMSTQRSQEEIASFYTLGFTLLTRAERPRRTACKKSKQDVSFPAGAFQNWDTSPANEWTLQHPELFKICYCVPGEKCSLPAGVSWSNSSRAANMRKAKPFSLWNLSLITKQKTTERQS